MGVQYNIPYKYLLTVPARADTMNPNMMQNLAEAIIAHTGHGRFKVIAMPESTEPGVVETAGILYGHLRVEGLAGSIETRRPSFEHLPKGTSMDERLAHILATALEPVSDCEILVLVMEILSAQRLPTLFIWDVLKNHRILRNVDQQLRPGWANVVNCVTKKRSTISPGNEHEIGCPVC